MAISHEGHAKEKSKIITNIYAISNSEHTTNNKYEFESKITQVHNRQQGSMIT